MRAIIVLLFSLLALPVAAQDQGVIAALSQNRVSITTNFGGSEILIFGTITREAPIEEDEVLDVIITVEGPQTVETVRRKDRRFGIWINVDTQVLGHSPTFYTVASTKPLDGILPHLTDTLYNITANERILPALKGNPYREALIRIRRDEGIYERREEAVELIDGTLFRTSVQLPANLTEGDYLTRIFLLREGDVIDTFSTSIAVQKVGIERWLYLLAHEHALVYGILALAIAIAAGWAASSIFRLIRRA